MISVFTIFDSANTLCSLCFFVFVQGVRLSSFPRHGFSTRNSGVKNIDPSSVLWLSNNMPRILDDMDIVIDKIQDNHARMDECMKNMFGCVKTSMSCTKDEENKEFFKLMDKAK